MAPRYSRSQVSQGEADGERDHLLLPAGEGGKAAAAGLTPALNVELLLRVARRQTLDRAEDAVEFIAQLKSDLQIPPLSQYGVLEVDYPEIIVKAASSSSMKGNPVMLTPDEMYTILELSQ